MKRYKARSPREGRIPLKNSREMSQLEAVGECAQGREEPLIVNEEEGKLLTSKFVLVVGVSFLLSKDEVHKPSMEVCLNDMEDLEVLEDLETTCFFEEATRR